MNSAQIHADRIAGQAGDDSEEKRQKNPIALLLFDHIDQFRMFFGDLFYGGAPSQFPNPIRNRHLYGRAQKIDQYGRYGENKTPPAICRMMIGKKTVKLFTAYKNSKNAAANHGLAGTYRKIISASIFLPYKK